MRYISSILLLLLPLWLGTTVWAAEEEVQKEPAQYITLKPSFVASMGARSYLKADISLRARGDDTVKQIDHHMPLVRDGLVLLFSAQTFADVEGAAGREQLRQSALQMLQQLLTQETGKPLVEDLLFTSFVVQR
ncbi:flagellar basal body-associated FliL family protein [Aestuariirhabdus sp. LZHN29]|uniref:flagellar basal body-associated FliL family protein n=1 Tax=Aestuariirhabdus sp. LZHN29 TaxID=3417462 RepID=UPI003CF57AAA